MINFVMPLDCGIYYLPAKPVLYLTEAEGFSSAQQLFAKLHKRPRTLSKAREQVKCLITDGFSAQRGCHDA